MTSRGALVCVAVLAVVAGAAVESHDLLSAQGEQGGRQLLNHHEPHEWTPAWVSHDGKVYALQGNFGSGNTVQLGGKVDQQASSAAVNNAQINDHSDGNGAVWQQNSNSGRKLLDGNPTTTPEPPKKNNSMGGKVYAVQGNLASGNTLQSGDKGDQQGNSAAVNNAQINKNSDENGAVYQSNNNTSPKPVTGGPVITGNPHHGGPVVPVNPEPVITGNPHHGGPVVPVNPEPVITGNPHHGGPVITGNPHHGGPVIP